MIVTKVVEKVIKKEVENLKKRKFKRSEAQNPKEF